jgi:hypothetical protein
MKKIILNNKNLEEKYLEDIEDIDFKSFLFKKNIFALIGKTKLNVYEEDTNRIKEGIMKINDYYYYCTFKEVDKYNENRFFIQKVDLISFIKNKLNIKDHIESFKLEIIEDSTYKLKKICLF